MEKALEYLSIARKAGFLVTGEDNSHATIQKGKAKILLIASDASENARHKAESFVRGTNVPVTDVPMTKNEIAYHTGKTGCSMAVLTNIGIASRLIACLAETDPDKYSDLADEINAKNVRTIRRKALTKARNRKMRTGKRRSK